MGKLTDHVGITSEALDLIDVICSRVHDSVIDTSVDRAAKENRDMVTKADILAVLRELNLYQYSDPED